MDHDPSDPIRGFIDTIGVLDDAASNHLRLGDIEVLGRMPYSSNGTFLCSVAIDDVRCRAIYKPEAGERPLWDFPGGLWRREVAAYELAHTLAWDVIPPTIERDGPFGVGSLQFFIPAIFEEHYFTFSDAPDLRDALVRLCAFDIVANNTDRKAGHVLLTEDRHIWGIDNGLSFHEDFKLRTVIWDFAGEPLPSEVAHDLQRLVEAPMPERLVELLTEAEREALIARCHALISGAHFPVDPTGRAVPWPLV